MDIAKLNRLNNEYRALISEAKNHRTAHGDVSTKEEGKMYQEAARIAGILATMSIGSEATHWLSCQSACADKIRIIWNDLNPNDTITSAPTKSAAPTTPKAKSASKPNDNISEATVASWFKSDPGYGFSDVAGMESIKKMLNNCVHDVTMEALYKHLKLPTVQSFFFYGPPGCGKTFLIEAFAHELMAKGYKYMKLGSADIHSKFSGEADKTVERAFAEAVNNAPCILFIDEIDGVCQNRSMPNLADFNMTLTTTFLTSFGSLLKANQENKSVIFIGATNYPGNVDSAMLDRVKLVPLPLPDADARSAVFFHSFNQETENPNGTTTSEPIITLEDGLTWEDLSEATEGYNQRDISSVLEMLKIKVKDSIPNTLSDVEAVISLKNGTYPLRREMLDDVISTYRPSPKDGVEAKLLEFEGAMNSR